MVGCLLGVGVASEGEAAGLEVNVDFGCVRGGNGKVDVVFLGVGGRRTLRPGHCIGGSVSKLTAFVKLGIGDCGFLCCTIPSGVVSFADMMSYRCA